MTQKWTTAKSFVDTSVTRKSCKWSSSRPTTKSLIRTSHIKTEHETERIKPVQHMSTKDRSSYIQNSTWDSSKIWENEKSEGLSKSQIQKRYESNLQEAIRTTKHNELSSRLK